MKKLSRAKNTMRNTLWGAIYRVATLIGPFAIKTIIIKELGQEYDRLRTQTEPTAAYARVQLQQAENALDQLGALLGGQAAALEPLKRLLDGRNGTAGAAEE